MRRSIHCPNCGNPAKAFRSRTLSTLVTEVVYQCGHVTCDARFVLVGEVHRWLRLPTQILTDLNVPLSPLIDREGLRATLDRLPMAELPSVGEIVGGDERASIVQKFEGRP